MTALGRRFLATDPLLLSALGVARFAGTVAVYTWREALPLAGQGGRWGGVFAGVTTYVTVTLRGSLDLPAGRSFVATPTAPGLVLLGAGVGSALTVRTLDTR